MTEENNKVITINDVDYTEDQLTDQQKVIINHISDLDRKIRNTQFSLDQLTVGKEAFVKMLTDSLEATEETEEAAA
jgi:NADH/NAD ratio-sensing transcriptional regulator Rex